MAKKMLDYEETVKGIKYRLTVPAEEAERYARYRAVGNWIGMVSLAERIENLTESRVIKCREFVTFGGRAWPKAGPSQAVDSDE